MLPDVGCAGQVLLVGASPSKASGVVLGVVDHLLGSGIGLVLKVIALEHERKLFERATHGLREHEVHKDNLKCEPAAVRDKVLPADVLETDGVDEGGEETGQATKELEDGDTTRALGIGPNFDHVSCIESVTLLFARGMVGFRLTVGQGVVTHVVARRVRVNEEEGSDVGPVVGLINRLTMHGALHGNGPRDVAEQQADGAGHVHDTTSDAGDEKRDGNTADQTPAGDGNVDLLDEGRLGIANHLEEIAEEV